MRMQLHRNCVHMDLRYITLITKNRGNWNLLLSLRERHCPLKYRALNHVLESPNYHIQNAIVFCNENIEVKDQIFYCPIYMAGFLEKRTVPEDYIYTLDLSVLQD